MGARSEQPGEYAARLCRRCSELDLARILNQTIVDSKHNLVCSLGELSADTSCPLCRFFYQASVPLSALASSSRNRASFRYRLCAFPTRAIFGGDRLLEPKIHHPVAPHIGLKVLIDKGYHHVSTASTRARTPEAEGLIMQAVENSLTFTGRHIGPQIDLVAVRAWLAYCNHTHQPQCTIEVDERERMLPGGFTVIDCHTRMLVLWTDRRSKTDNDKEDFATLSYVWGNSPLIPESKTAGEKLDDGLPLTIEDAIRICSQLGFRYLWIDRYCIDQNNATAKQTQVQAMDAIYACSALTIIAAGGEDPSYGLPGVSARHRVSQAQIRVGDDLHLVFCPYNVRNQVTSSKWYTRGWTYQEGLLSRRRLVFTDTQTYFQCNGMHCLESLSAPLDRLHVAERTNQATRRMSDAVNVSRVFPLRGLGRSSLEIGHRLDEYIRRDLTSEDDVLNAIQGIFNAYKTLYSTGSGTKARPFRKLMGVPILPLPTPPALPLPPTLRNAKTWPVQPPSDVETDNARDRACDLQELVAGLCWLGQVHPSLVQATSTSSVPAIRRRKFPSWSWAGWRLHGFQLSPLVEDIPLLYQRQQQQQHLWRFGRSGNATKILVDDDVQIQVKTSSQEQEVLNPWTVFVGNDTQPTFSWMSRAGVRSVILHITAPCLDVLVSDKGTSIRTGDKTLIADAVDWKLLFKQAAAASRSEDLQSGTGSTCKSPTTSKFTLLLMAQVSAIRGADAFRNHLLVLKRSDEVDTMVRLAAVMVSGNFRWSSSFAGGRGQSLRDEGGGAGAGNDDMETFTGWKKRRMKIE